MCLCVCDCVKRVTARHCCCTTKIPKRRDNLEHISNPTVPNDGTTNVPSSRFALPSLLVLSLSCAMVNQSNQNDDADNADDADDDDDDVCDAKKRLGDGCLSILVCAFCGVTKWETRRRGLSFHPGLNSNRSLSFCWVGLGIRISLCSRQNENEISFLLDSSRQHRQCVKQQQQQQQQRQQHVHPSYTFSLDLCCGCQDFTHRANNNSCL